MKTKSHHWMTKSHHWMSAAAGSAVAARGVVVSAVAAREAAVRILRDHTNHTHSMRITPEAQVACRGEVSPAATDTRSRLISRRSAGGHARQISKPEYVAEPSLVKVMVAPVYT
jgi:hypothetical protein